MILTAEGLGKRFRQRWALADSLLNLAVGLLEPTAGSLAVLGARPGAQLAKVGFVAQDTPVNAALSAREHLRLGAKLNPGWDDALARDCLARIGLDPDERAGRLSGGQRAQLALTLGVAKRPEVLILDEPVASLDPLARRDFLAYLMEAVAEHGLSVILSSHLVSDLERVCDHLIVLVASRVKVAGDIDELLATHVRLLDPDWTVGELTLEDLVLAYMTPPVERRRALEAVR
jgi:ABC-2 type transport system ATP-binding protein